jgi:hypothetical protein
VGAAGAGPVGTGVTFDALGNGALASAGGTTGGTTGVATPGEALGVAGLIGATVCALACVGVGRLATCFLVAALAASSFFCSSVSC